MISPGPVGCSGCGSKVGAVGADAKLLLRVGTAQPGRCRSVSRHHAWPLGRDLTISSGALHSVHHDGRLRPSDVETGLTVRPRFDLPVLGCSELQIFAW